MKLDFNTFFNIDIQKVRRELIEIKREKYNLSDIHEKNISKKRNKRT